nr:MAG TPA: HNHc [Caudoviricetes sp.]
MPPGSASSAPRGVLYPEGASKSPPGVLATPPGVFCTRGRSETTPGGVVKHPGGRSCIARATVYISSVAFRVSGGPFEFGEGVATLVSSRTGTSQYKHWRTRVLAAGRAAGITHCPVCNVVLDYVNTRTPASAEPDHILPHRWGGKNVLENGRVLCRRCNQSRGDRVNAPKRQARPSSVDVDW